MKTNRTLQSVVAALVAGAALLFTPARAYAHCDTMDGPVVKAAQAALASNRLTPVLMWVPAGDEPEVRHVFEQTLAVRKLGKQAAEVADRYFFETVVRIHRAGEGEPYTGLKPAGTYLGHAVPAADRALVSGSSAELRSTLLSTFNARLDEYFADVLKKRTFSPDDVAAGREYVESYVKLMHFSEELEALTSAHDHAGNDAPLPATHHPL